MKARWQLQEAKSRLTEVIDRAVAEGPQVITRRGVETAVVVSAEQYKKLQRSRQPLSKFFRASPLAGLDLTRLQDPPRDTSL